MVTLEQVKLLENKVVRAIEYVERISRENSQLQGKLDSYQKRIDELEVLIQQFREDQGKIEEGILAALDRLNKFEDAMEKSIAGPPQPEPKAPRRAGKPGPGMPPQGPGDSPPSKPEPKTRIPPAQEAEDLLNGGPEDEEPGGGEDFSDGSPAAGELDIF
jgi:TolA-binding protein